MTTNNNISPLPWYTDIAEQQHRLSYSYGEVYPLYTLANTMLPFQIIRAHRSNGIQSIVLYTADGKQSWEVTTEVGRFIQIHQFADYGYDVIIFGGRLPVFNNQLSGQYYATISDGAQTWWSEVWTVVQDITPYLRIEWYDYDDFVFDGGRICYKQAGFHNELYFASEIGKPEYTFNEEGENRDGYFFPEKQISEKTYKFTILAPEYLCDVMRFIRMADVVVIRDKYGRIYNCDTFLMTPKWQTQGNLASVEVEFETDTVAKKIMMRPVGGDFNNDFNDDFFIHR